MYRLNIFVFFCLLIIGACTSLKTKVTKNNPPNIIILLADDLGYGDLGCYGGNARTPHLDQLAQEGIRFTDFYSSAPNCSPSRVGLLTGRSPTKVGMYNHKPVGHPMHLKAEEITIAEIVKQKNYQTGHFGKWHVSNLASDADTDQPQPDEQGFDYSLGTSNNSQPSHLNPTNFVRNGQKTGEIKGYSCQIVVKDAINWLKGFNSKKDPFLLYIAFHEPHKKVASPPELVAHYPNFPKKDAEYLANVENVDNAIGNLRKGLVELGVDENTIIIFSSDNGSYRNGSNGPLLGGKSFVYEGGIRVPGILHWKGKIKGGQTISEPVGLVDIMPTICDLVEVNHPKTKVLDGTSLLPIIQEQPFQRTKPLSWFFYRTTPEIAMRIGEYTILGKDSEQIQLPHSITQPDMEYIKNMTLETFELYNLKKDIGQEHSIDYTRLEFGENYKNQLVKRLKELQETGVYWNDLPPSKYGKRLKKDWRQLRPTGFSN